MTVLALSAAAIAGAATIDMNDPRRAVGLEGNIRVDAVLASEFVSTGSSIQVTYQVQNLSPEAIALAGQACDVSYDADSRTITFGIGMEVPRDGEMPHLVTIKPGETRLLSVAGVLRNVVAAVPRFVRIRVSILRNLNPFWPLMKQRQQSKAAVVLSDEQFDQWLQQNESIFLNPVPVRYRKGEVTRTSDASRR